MKCGSCRLCVVEKEFIDELPDGNDYSRFETVQWEKGDKEKPFCLVQSLYTYVDPEKDCCNESLKKFATERGEEKWTE